MSLLELCQWIQFSPPLVAMRSSPWLFPIIASIHLMGLTLIGGAVLVGDLRLLGFGLSRQPVALVARDAERWLIAGLLIMVPTGILQFMCFATKYYYLRFFWVKMAALFLVLVFTFSARRKITATADETPLRPGRSRLAALVSLSLWTTIAIGGRWIGFP
jgi:Family of unknown function (DUF6644)